MCRVCKQGDKVVSNYPPGVTGNEFEIAGPDYEQDYPDPCPKCSSPMVEQGYRWERWVICVSCDYREDLPEREVRHDREYN